MHSIENKVINRIYGYGRGCSFFEKDFADIGSTEAVRIALSRLTKAKKIRRVIRGIYDYPKFSELLKEDIPPDLLKVAQTLARKFGWRIQPSGATALNALGLSTQVPGRTVFLSDGPSKTYQVMDRTLEFQSAGLKEAALKHMQSDLVVQSIKSLGKERMDHNLRKRIKNQLSDQECTRILRDTKYVTRWVYDEIKKVCAENYE